MPFQLARDLAARSPVLLDIPKWNYYGRLEQLSRENARLLQENERLRLECGSLSESSHTWIRLYEAALSRASAAEAKAAGHRGR